MFYDLNRVHADYPRVVKWVIAIFTTVALVALPAGPMFGKNIEPDKPVLFKRARPTLWTEVFLSINGIILSPASIRLPKEQNGLRLQGLYPIFPVYSVDIIKYFEFN